MPSLPIRRSTLILLPLMDFDPDKWRPCTKIERLILVYVAIGNYCEAVINGHYNRTQPSFFPVSYDDWPPQLKGCTFTLLRHTRHVSKTIAQLIKSAQAITPSCPAQKLLDWHNESMTYAFGHYNSGFGHLRKFRATWYEWAQEEFKTPMRELVEHYQASSVATGDAHMFQTFACLHPALEKSTLGNDPCPKTD